MVMSYTCTLYNVCSFQLVHVVHLILAGSTVLEYLLENPKVITKTKLVHYMMYINVNTLYANQHIGASEREMHYYTCV